MKTPPASFVRALTSYNKDLRVRWSFERRKWVIEHRVYDRRALFVPARMEMTTDGKIIEHIMPAMSDRFIQYHDMHYGVIYVTNLDNRVFETLASMDTAHYKSGKAYARAVEDREQGATDYAERKKREELADYSADVWSYLKVRGEHAFPNGRAM